MKRKYYYIVLYQVENESEVWETLFATRKSAKEAVKEEINHVVVELNLKPTKLVWLEGGAGETVVCPSNDDVRYTICEVTKELED